MKRDASAISGSLSFPTVRETRSPFLQGCTDSLPVCLSFLFLFSSIGALSRAAGFSLLQAAVMTLTVHAAPLQVFVTQHSETLTAVSLVGATLLVNFRFLIMSSALMGEFRAVPLWKMLLSTQLLSVSTFTLSTTKKGHVASLYQYYLGCGASTLAAAFLATLLGIFISAEQNGLIAGLVGMILPIHFTALTGLTWPKTRPVLVTGSGFALTPVAAHWLGEYQVFVMPFVIAAFFILADRVAARRAA